jgi:hypothetical protein
VAFGDVIQSKTGTTAQGGASTLAITYDSSPTDGNLLLAAATTRAASQTTPSGWSVAKSQDDGPNTDNLTVYYKIAGAAESSTVTFNDSTAGQVILATCQEIEGSFNASPLDATNGALASATQVISTGTTGTLSQADEFIYAAAVLRENSNVNTGSSVDSSFTELSDSSGVKVGYDPTGQFASCLTDAYKLVAVTTAENEFLIAAIATFKKAAAGGVTIPLMMHHYRQQGMSY